MKPSFQKLQKIFKLEAERGFDNHAVVGGLERMMDTWESEARLDGTPEDLIQHIRARFHDYAHLSEKSRSETLQGLWRRIQRLENPSAEQIGSPEAIEASTPQENPAPPTPEPPFLIEEINQIESIKPEETEEIEMAPIPPPSPPVVPLSPVQKRITPTVEPKALSAPVTVLQGVGPRIAQNLNRLGLITLRDMLYNFPRRYDDYSKFKPINRLFYGDEVTVIGTVKSVQTRTIRGGKSSMVEALVSDSTGTLRINWFNQTWLAKRLHEGSMLVVSGKVDQYLGRLVMTNPEVEPLDEQQLNTNRIVPVYSLTSQVTQHWLRKQMYQVISYWAPRIQDPVPEQIRKSADLIDLSDALLQIHYPDSWDYLKAAQERLAFDEIFLLQLGVVTQKRKWQDRTARIYDVPDAWLQDRISQLPYELTNAQKKTIEDIRNDLASGRPLNRLIQGDVGSGKTVVAAIAIGMVVRQDAQACMMAPTSLLADQHYQKMLELLSTSQAPIETESESVHPPSVLKPEEIALLVGSTPEGEKIRIRAGLNDGTIKLVIGTHALLEDPVIFKDLQLAVIDEQHRFGVDQRSALRQKGENAHLLVMTATPIPRSLALTIYGDLDLSVMDEMPPGRMPVGTFVLMPRERERAYSLIHSQVGEGRQVFIIYPLIEESENISSPAAVSEFENIQNEIFPMFRVGLLHGRMKPEEKESVMQLFRKGEYQILVSTTVIEVGVDIPNATIMLVEGANRFGLSQLHQLRGRVGRGADKSFCLLIPDKPDEIENARLQVMASTNDGFVLAEKDLEQRGPGQFLGDRQSGFNEFQMAALANINLIEKARRHVINLLGVDPDLSAPEHQALAFYLHQHWGSDKGEIS